MEWNPDLPINTFPEEISFIFSEEARYLINDLRINKLKVELIPALEKKFPDHKIRTVVNSNPEWYRTLFHTYTHFKRKRCMAALERIAEKKDRFFRVNPYKYDARMRELIYEKVYNTGDYDSASFKINDSNKEFNLLKEPLSLFSAPEEDFNFDDIPF